MLSNSSSAWCLSLKILPGGCTQGGIYPLLAHQGPQRLLTLPHFLKCYRPNCANLSEIKIMVILKKDVYKSSTQFNKYILNLHKSMQLKKFSYQN